LRGYIHGDLVVLGAVRMHEPDTLLSPAVGLIRNPRRVAGERMRRGFRIDRPLLADAVSPLPDCSGSGPALLENTMSPTTTAATARLPAPVSRVLVHLLDNLASSTPAKEERA